MVLGYYSPQFIFFGSLFYPDILSCSRLSEVEEERFVCLENSKNIYFSLFNCKGQNSLLSWSVLSTALYSLHSEALIF